MRTQENNEALGNWKNLIKYCHEILKHSRRGQKTFINLRDSARIYLDLSEIFEEERLLYEIDEKILIRKPKIDAYDQREELYETDAEVKRPTPFDKLRRIYDHVTNNPHEFEVLYCYLFVYGKKDTLGKEEVFAPLFTVPARVEYDLRKGFEVELASDELRLNIYGLAELYPEKESALFRPGFLECPPLPLTLESVNELLKKISDFHPSIECKELTSTKYNKIDNLRLPPGKFVVQNTAVVALTKKDNIYLINDLKKLLDGNIESSTKSILGRFLQKGVEGEEPDPKPPARIHYFFPFKNNPSQRRVLEGLISSQLVHVQGPPGTGKSQTIANLICYLVATGRTVLVTSQKNKALEVVGEMLDRLSIKYLYMMLLKDDKESKKRIKDLVEEILHEASSYREEELYAESNRLEKKIEQCNSAIAELYQEFRDAQAFERKELNERPIGKIYASYSRIKDWDYFERNEPVSKEGIHELKDALGAYFDHLSMIEEKYWQLMGWVKDPSIPSTPETINTFLEDLSRLCENLDEELSLCKPGEIESLQRKLPILELADPKSCNIILEETNLLKEDVGHFICEYGKVSGILKEAEELIKDESVPKTAETINAFLHNLGQLCNLLEEELSLSSPQQVEAFLEKIPTLHRTPPDTLLTLKDRIEGFVRTHQKIISDSELTQLQKELLESQINAGKLGEEDISLLEKVREELELFFGLNPLMDTSPYSLHELEQALNDYVNKKWFKRLNPSSRTVLENVIRRPLKKVTKKELDDFQLAIKKRRYLEAINGKLMSQLKYLKVSPLTSQCSSEDRIRILGAIDGRIQLLRFLQMREELTSECERFFGNFLSIDQFLQRGAFLTIQQAIAVSKALLVRKSADEILLKLYPKQLSFTPKTVQCQITTAYKKKDKEGLLVLVERLRKLLPPMPDLLNVMKRREELGVKLKEFLGDFVDISECIPDKKQQILLKFDKVYKVARALIKRNEASELVSKLGLESTEDKDILLCPQCKFNLRAQHIPFNKGKLEVTCQWCKREFSFDPQKRKYEIWSLTKYFLLSAYKEKNIQELAHMHRMLQVLLPLIPNAIRLREIEEGEPLKRYPKALSKLRDLCLQDPHKLQSLQDNLEKLIEAGYLKTLVNDVESKKIRCTEEITSDVRKEEKEKLEIIKRYIDTAVKLNLAIALTRQNRRNDLLYFARILQRSKKRYTSFEQLKEQVDFEALLSVLPCWIVSIEDVARIFPLKEGLFDVIIVDEASQCGIPSAIPILYRGKKAVIVGDDKQLHNIEYQFIDEGFNNSKIRECNIEELPRHQAFNCRDNSLFDLCAVFTEHHIFLNEHFRCYPEIIRFCNERFYNNRLQLTKVSLDNMLGPILNLCVVEGAYDDEDMKVNKKEAEALVAKLKELLTDEKYHGMFFGVLSVFREQVEFLKDLVFNEIPPSDRQEFRLIVDTADGFQGDERDVILYSFRYAPNSSPSIFAHLRREEDYKRLNVALSRARNQIFCFVSVPPRDFPNVLHLRDYLVYVQDPKSVNFDFKLWNQENEFEKEVHYELEQKGLKVYPQFKTCGYRVDFVVTDEKGKVLIVEVDGWQYHYDEYGQLLGADVERQNILERAGWKVRRITSRDYYRDKQKTLKPILEYFGL